MVATTFPRALAAVLEHEGGFVNHPRDPGGATNKGITIANFRRYVKRDGTVADLKKISDAAVAEIYRKHYWDAISGDALPAGLDYAVFDYAVNSGPVRAAKHLQEVLGVEPDGIVGPVTIAAAFKAGPDAITVLCDKRMRFLRRLTTWSTFGKGWSSRILGVRTLASEMARTAPSPIPGTTTPPKPVPAPQRPTARPSGAVGWIGIAIFIVTTAAVVLAAAWDWIVKLLGF